MEVNGKHVALENGGEIELTDSKLMKKDFFLRIIMFAFALAAVVLMATSNQTKLVKLPSFPVSVPMTSKYTDSPAFIYFVASLSLAISYSFITAIVIFRVHKKRLSSKSLLKFYLILIANDVVMVGLMAAGTASAGSVGYIGLRGNSKVGWNKICDIYGKFCRQIAVAISLSLVVSILLAVLVVLSAYSVNRLARKALK